MDAKETIKGTRRGYSTLLSIRDDTSLIDGKIDTSSNNLTIGTIHMVSQGQCITEKLILSLPRSPPSEQALLSVSIDRPKINVQ